MDIQADYPYSHPFPPYGFPGGVPTDQAAQQMALYSYQLGVEHLQPVSSASTVAAVAGMTMDAPLPVVSVSDSGGDSDDFSPDSATVDSNLMDAAIRDLADATAVGAAVNCDIGHDALRAATESSPEGDEDESSHLDFGAQDGSVGAGASSAGGNGTGTAVKKKRRGRVRFTDRQIETLEQRFIQDQYLPALERTHLASMVGLNESQVKTWFQNRRAKSKRAAKRKARAAAAHLASQQQQQQQGTGLALGARNAAPVPAAVSAYNAVNNAAYNSAAFNASAAIQYQASQQAAAAAALHMNAYASHQPYAATAMLNGMAAAAAVPGNSASSAAAYAQPYAAAAAAAAAAVGAPTSAINMGSSPTYQSASQLTFGSGNPSVPFDTSVPTSQSAYSLFSDPHSSASLPDYYRFLGANPSGVPL